MHRFELVDRLPPRKAMAHYRLALALEGEPECAVRGGKLLVPRLERVRSEGPEVEEAPLVRSDGAVLVTGGTGVLGSAVVAELVKVRNRG